MISLNNDYLKCYFNRARIFGDLEITEEFIKNISVSDVADLTQVILKNVSFHPTMTDCVVNLIRQMSPVDWLLFLNKPHYREHKFHQFRAALTAVWLFDEITKHRNDFRDLKEKIAAALWVATVLHDHGMALSRFAELCPLLTTGGDTRLTSSGVTMFSHLKACYEGLYAEQLVQQYCDACDTAKPDAAEQTSTRYKSIRKTIRKYLERVGLDNDFVDWLGEDEKQLYDHGLWSAINLSACLCKVGMPWEHIGEEDRRAIQMVIHAIAVHNREDRREEDFGLDKNQFSSVLCLADQLQEWDRIAVPKSQPVDIGCEVKVCMQLPDTIKVHFTYSDNDLKEANWDMDWKKHELEKINSATGMPKIEVETIRSSLLLSRGND